MLASEVILCEDGHAQERSLLRQVLPFVAPEDLWIAIATFEGSIFCAALRRAVAVLWCASTAN